MNDIQIEIIAPLQECFRHSEVECQIDCCGIDSISTDELLMIRWARSAGPIAVTEAVHQLEELIVLVHDRTQRVILTFLNHVTGDETSRLQLLTFLMAFQRGLIRFMRSNW